MTFQVKLVDRVKQGQAAQSEGKQGQACVCIRFGSPATSQISYGVSYDTYVFYELNLEWNRKVSYPPMKNYCVHMF